MIADSSTIQTTASSPSPPHKFAPELREILAEADNAFESKWSEQMPYVRDKAYQARRAASRKSGFPLLHRERAKGLFQTDGPWANELCRLAVHYQRLTREPRAAVRVELGVLFALVGCRGSGKTQLAACLGRLGVALTHHPKYTTAQALFRKLRTGFHDRVNTEQALIDTMVKTSLLVIDDLHDRGQSDFEMRTLNNIIDERYSSGKFTLLISNETHEHFIETVGPSIASRFVESGEVTTLKWQSFRTTRG